MLSLGRSESANPESPEGARHGYRPRPRGEREKKKRARDGERRGGGYSHRIRVRVSVVAAIGGGCVGARIRIEAAIINGLPGCAGQRDAQRAEAHRRLESHWIRASDSGGITKLRCCKELAVCAGRMLPFRCSCVVTLD